MEQTIREVVPTYHTPDEVNFEIKNSREEIEENTKNAKRIIESIKQTNKNIKLKTTAV